MEVIEENIHILWLYDVNVTSIRRGAKKQFLNHTTIKDLSTCIWTLGYDVQQKLKGEDIKDIEIVSKRFEKAFWRHEPCDWLTESEIQILKSTQPTDSKIIFKPTK
jgi:hypothetical protein